MRLGVGASFFAGPKPDDRDIENLAGVRAIPGGWHLDRAIPGRHGSTLQTGRKTDIPVLLRHAREIYEKLIREKIAKGYRIGEPAAEYQPTATASSEVRILPQLLNPNNESDALRLVADPAWCMQEKFDGQRALIRKRANDVEGSNRRGKVFELPLTIEAAVRELADKYKEAA